jgi:uncharacterized membrane protein
MNVDLTRLGWLIVGIVLSVSGIRHMIAPEIYGRVRVSGSPPLMEGWPVFLIGLVELAVGITLVVRFVKAGRDDNFR